jgi:hypothetical protein
MNGDNRRENKFTSTSDNERMRLKCNITGSGNLKAEGKWLRDGI